MAITLDGTTGITTPGLTNTGSLSIVNFTTSGAGPSNLIGVGRCFFEMTGGSFQYINSLG
jgi:hypothetical protein